MTIDILSKNILRITKPGNISDWNNRICEFVCNLLPVEELPVAGTPAVLARAAAKMMLNGACSKEDIEELLKEGTWIA